MGTTLRRLLIGMLAALAVLFAAAPAAPAGPAGAAYSPVVSVNGPATPAGPAQDPVTADDGPAAAATPAAVDDERVTGGESAVLPPGRHSPLTASTWPGALPVLPWMTVRQPPLWVAPPVPGHTFTPQSDAPALPDVRGPPATNA